MKYAIVETRSDIFIRKFEKVSSNNGTAIKEIKDILSKENVKHDSDVVRTQVDVGIVNSKVDNKENRDVKVVSIITEKEYGLYKKGSLTISDMIEKDNTPNMHDCNRCIHNNFELKK